MKMKLNLLTVGAAIALTASYSNAGTLAASNLAALAGDTLIAINDVPVPVGSAVAQAGYFNVGFDVDAAAAAGDYTELIANFNALGTGVIGNTAGLLGANVAGLYDVNADYGNSAGQPFEGALLYTFIGNKLDLASSTGYALINSGETADPDGATPDSNLMPLLGGTYLIGTVGGGTTADLSPILGAGNENVAMGTFNLVVVPEPSALLLGLVGFVGLLRRRR